MTGRLRTAVLVPGGLATSVGVLGVVTRSIAIGWQPMIVLVAIFPALAVCGLLGGALFAVTRWWPGAIVAVAVVVWTVVVQAPLFVASTASGGTALTVLQANLMIGGAGAGIWSATPLTDTNKIEDFSFELLSATISPVGASSIHIVAVHLLPPWPYPSRTWTSELTRLRDGSAPSTAR